MKSITYNGVTYHCPLSEQFRRHTPDELAAIRERARMHGRICVAIRTYHDTTLDLPDCVLDGEGRLTSAVDLKLPPDKVPFYSEGRRATEEAYDLAMTLNDARRHDDPEAVRKRRAERARRVAELRAQGLSTRAIADQVGTDQATVVRDLARGDAGASPDDDSGATPTPSKVNGADGKKYPAHPRRPKWMKPGYNGDPNHPYAKILAALSHMSGLITAAMNAAGDDRLKAVLTHLSGIARKTLMVDHRERIVDGKKHCPRFVGLRALRAVIRLAGKMQRPLNPKQVADAFDQANNSEAAEEE